MISWYSASFYKKSTLKFEKLGNLPVEISYDPEKDFQCYSQWNMIKEFIERNEKITKERGEPNKSLKLKKLRKNHWL
jgi:ribosomal protein L11